MDQLIANVNTLVEYISFLEIYTNAGFFFLSNNILDYVLLKKLLIAMNILPFPFFLQKAS